MLTEAEKTELLALVDAQETWQRQNLIRAYFPDKLIRSWPGQDAPFYPRSGYPKHMGFFAAGNHRERAFIAGNRTGKSIAGAFEVACHLTGLYPHWWTGRRFGKPVSIWIAGDTSKTVKEILQLVMLGKPGRLGEGMIPASLIIKTTAKSGIADAVDTVHVTHATGGLSDCTFKSYDQRRESFQGTAKEVIWLDEECPEDIYTECLLRLMTTHGILMLTWTPLMGLTDVVLKFLQDGSIDKLVESETRHVTIATWDDAAHLDEKTKRQMLEAIPPYQRDARSKGVPQLGSGAIYPVPESQIVVDDFEVPKWWPRGYGLDVGWNFTAIPFLTRNPDTGVAYVYKVIKVSNKTPSEVVKLIAAVGNMRGVIDPAARGRGQKDGEQLIQSYRDLGLNVVPANNAVESGLYEVWQRLVSGRLKVFKGCEPLLAEYRIYRRDEKGNIVKANDHAMDAWRYAVMSFLVDGLTMTQPVQVLADEDVAMWGARQSGTKRTNPMQTGV